MPSTKRAESALRTRAAVMAAAKHLFAIHGLDAVTMRQVAREAGVSTGAVFAHVVNKDDLFEQATGRKIPMARVKDALIGAAERGETPPWGSEGAALLLQDLYGDHA